MFLGRRWGLSVRFKSFFVHFVVGEMHFWVAGVQGVRFLSKSTVCGVVLVDFCAFGGFVFGGFAAFVVSVVNNFMALVMSVGHIFSVVLVLGFLITEDNDPLPDIEFPGTEFLL
jgi:hypothetical protein